MHLGVLRARSKQGTKERVLLAKKSQRQKIDVQEESRMTMKNTPLITCVIGAMLFAAVAPNAAMSLPIEKASEAIADRLVDKQAPDGSLPGEADFTGSIVAGMVTAYEVMEKAEYKAAQNSAGNSFLIMPRATFMLTRRMLWSVSPRLLGIILMRTLFGTSTMRGRGKSLYKKDLWQRCPPLVAI